MSDIKYTTDGKKVAVIGKLNNHETIVQEIFINGENEIPQGENFVVKSLLDAPAISWKENELIKINARYEREQKSTQAEIDRLNKAYREKTAELRAKLQYVGLCLKNVAPQSFDTIVNFICGDIEWVVVETYSTPQILPYAKFKQTYEDKLRLLTIFGKDDGTLAFYQNEYHNASGSYGNTRLYPFTDYESALVKFKECIYEYKYISENIIAIAKEYKIKLDTEKVAAWKLSKKTELEKNIAQQKDSIVKSEEAIKKLAKL